MDDGYSPVSIVVLVLFILLEAVFYGFGAAIQNLNEGKLEEEAKEGNVKARRLLDIVNQPGRFVHTIQITTHLIAMVTGALILPAQVRQLMKHMGFLQIEGGQMTPWYCDPQWWGQLFLMALVAFVLILVIISFGIIIPKRLAYREPEKWGYQMLPAVLLFTTVCFPVTKAITCLSALVLKLFGMELTDEDDNVTEEDIMSMVNEGHEQGVLEAGETEMITNIFQLGDKEAADIMTHRTSMEALDASMTLGEALDFILNEGVNTRYPVYGEDIDDIVGILHLRDAMTYGETPENKGKTLREIPMVVVVDEYGQTAGLLTMEDILEEIVGNIMDEYDEEEEFITAREDGSYVMSGLTPLEEAAQVLEMEFSEEDMDTYDTLNGFLISRLDRIPQVGEQPELDYGSCHFKVIKVGNKMIESVLVTPLPENDSQTGEEAR